MPKRRLQRTAEEDVKEWTDNIWHRFITEKKALGAVQETIQTYEYGYKKFCRYFGDRVEYIGDIYGAMFPEWAAAMREEGLKTKSINHYLIILRAFMNWCMEDNHNYLTEHCKIRLVKTREQDDTTKEKDYSAEEVKLLLKKPDKKANFVEWRSWAASCFVIGTGARMGTLVEIRMKDIDLKEGTVHYQHTKNRKDQIVNLPPQLIKVLTDYIAMWRTKDTEPEDYLFCNISGEQVSKGAFRIGYGQFTKSRGVNRTNIHGLRHTFARIWYENGGDVVQLSKVLGHTTLRMSEHYMHVYANSVKERFIENNPLESLTRSGPRKNVQRND